MANKYTADKIWNQQSNVSADTALSAYEKEVFESYMKRQSVERAQHNAANDLAQDSLSYLFAIFH